MNATSCFLRFAALASVLSSAAGDIPSWRNGGNGLYPDAKPPLEDGSASESSWTTELSKRANASPILVGDRLFLTAEPASLICVDAKSGELLWQKSNGYTDLMELTPEMRAEIAAARERAEASEERARPLERELYRAERQLRRNRDDQELSARVEELKKELAALEGEPGPLAGELKLPPAHDSNGYASYTPVSDGKHVWAVFGIGVAVCYDLEGGRVWGRRTDTPDHNWGGASSPTLVGDKLILRFSDYVALDPATGEEQWRTPSEGVVFNAPASFELEGEAFLLTPRGAVLRVADGKKIWSAGYKVEAKPWCFMNTPSIVDGHAYFAHGCEGEQGDAYCLELPDSVAELEESGLAQKWKVSVDRNRYYSSPLVHDGIVYLISREFVLQALGAESGEKFFEEKIRGFTGTAYPSLTLAGDAIFVGAEDGNFAFLKPGREYQEIKRAKVPGFRSTPIFADRTMFLRTQDDLRAVVAR